MTQTKKEIKALFENNGLIITKWYGKNIISVCDNELQYNLKNKESEKLLSENLHNDYEIIINKIKTFIPNVKLQNGGTYKIKNSIWGPFIWVTFNEGA